MFGGRKALRGFVTIELRDARTGEIKHEEVTNVVVDTGEDWVADRMLPNSLQGATTGQQEMKWIELGLGSAAAVGTDTDLQTTFNPRTEVRKIYTTNDRSGATWNIIVNWTTSEANTNGIKEAGIFSTASIGGHLLARTVFTAVNKTSSDTLKIQWQINVSDDGA